MGNRRVIKIIGAIDHEAYKEFSDQLDELVSENNKKPITIELCSGGGDSYAGIAFYSKIKSCPVKIIIKAYGQVMSAATIILIAGHERLIHRDCWFMTHDDSRKVKTETVEDAISEAKHIENLELHWALIMSRDTKCTKETWRDLSRKTTYMDAEMCVTLGVADAIIN